MPSEAGPKKTFGAGDSHEFAVSLLRETYVFLPDEARSLSPTLSFEHLSTQSEVVNRVIQHLFRAAVLDEPNNVLCYGFRKQRATGGGAFKLELLRCLEIVFGVHDESRLIDLHFIYI
eukprot:gene522-918_t